MAPLDKEIHNVGTVTRPNCIIMLLKKDPIIVPGVKVLLKMKFIKIILVSIIFIV